jgi:hypothetical protein
VLADTPEITCNMKQATISFSDKAESTSIIEMCHLLYSIHGRGGGVK